MILYPDVSHHNAGVDVSAALALIAKATQGTGFVDPEYVHWPPTARTFAAYHWLDTTSASAQAAHCYSVVGAGMPLMIDDEQGVINVAHTLEFASAYRKLGGLVTMWYGPRWVWDASGKPDLRPIAAAGLAVIGSWYGQGYAPTAPGWTPYGGVAPTILQYTDAQPFGGKLVDFNAFPGTIDQLSAVFYGRKETPMSLAFVTVSDGPHPGGIYLSNGIERRHLPNMDALTRAAKAFGLAADPDAIKAIPVMTAALADAAYGPDMATAIGPPPDVRASVADALEAGANSLRSGS